MLSWSFSFSRYLKIELSDLGVEGSTFSTSCKGMPLGPKLIRILKEINVYTNRHRPDHITKETENVQIFG